MIKLKVTRVERISIPDAVKLKMKREDWEEIGKIVVDGVRQNIERQRQADGSPLKQNSPSTIARKRAEGKRPLALVDQFRRFVKRTAASWHIWTRENGVDVYPIEYTGGDPDGATLAQLTRKVQEQGYVGWFGIHASTLLTIRKVVRRHLRAVFDSMKSKVG